MFKLFKNACIYRLTKKLPDLNPIALAEAMKTYPFTLCTSQESARTGWVMSDDVTPFMLSFGPHILITLRSEIREVPKEAVKLELKKQSADYERRLGSPPRRPEKMEMRAKIIEALQPRVFSKNTYTQILIDTAAETVMVDSSSARSAENALALLRKTMGSLPVYPVAAATAPYLTMTEWAKSPAESLPPAVTIEDKKICFMNAFEPSMKMNFSNLNNADITRQLVDTNNMVMALSLVVKTRYELGLTLTSDLQFKSLSFSSALTEQSHANAEDEAGDNSESEERQLLMQKATFILMAGELSEAWRELIAALGGEAEWHDAIPEKATSEPETAQNA